MAATFVQSKAGTAATSGKVASAQYDNNVTAGNLLVAVVSRTVTTNNSPACAITDDLGNRWKQAGEGVVLGTPYGTGYDHGTDVWYCESAGPGSGGGTIVPDGLVLDGTSGCWAHTPDNAAWTISGVMRAVLRVKATDWTSGGYQVLLAQWDNTSSNLAWIFFVSPTGNLGFGLSTNGTSAGVFQESSAPSLSDATTYWVGLEYNTAGGANNLKFYTAADAASPPTIFGSWTLVSQHSVAGATPFASTAALSLGANDAGGTASQLTGTIYRAALYDDGVLVADPDFTATGSPAAVPGAGSYTDSQGRVWTISGSAVIASTVVGGGNRPVITATLQGYPTGTMTRMVVFLLEYGNGAGGYEPLESSGMTATTGTTVTATTRDSLSANDLAISVVIHNGNAATVPAGWNSRVNDTTTDYAVADLLDTGGAGTESAAWTGLTGNTKGYALILAFKPGGTRASNAIRCVRQQYRLEELFTGTGALGSAESPAFVAPTVGNSLILFTSPYVGNNAVEVTDDHGNQWEQLFDGGFDTYGDGQNSLWICRRAVGGAPTITITVTLAIGQGSQLWNQTFFVLLEYQGLPADADVLTSGVVLSDLGASGTGVTSASVATTAATPATSTLVLGLLGGGAEVFGTLNNGAGWLPRFSDSGAEIGVLEKVTATPAVQTASWSWAVAQVASYFVVALGSRSVTTSPLITTQRRASFVAPSLPLFVGQRAESIEWEVLESDNTVIGVVSPLGQDASIRHDVGSDIIRTVDGLELSEADCAEMNMLRTRIRPVWIMDDLSRWPLGVFMFSAADRHPRKRAGQSSRTMSMYDQNAVLLYKRREAFGLTRGQSLYYAMLQLIEEVQIPAAEIGATGAVAGDDLAWPPATPRLTILRHLCALSGLLRPYFDNRGVLVIRASPDLDSVEPDVSYDTGPSSRIDVESIVTAQDLFDAPNVFLVTGAGATSSEISAYGLVPASQPHSVQNRGYEIVEEIRMQGIADSDAGFLVARALAAQRVSDWATYEFEAAPDPRHDTFQIIGVDSVNYREVSWDLPCRRGGPHRHSLRQAYTLVQNATDTAPSGVGEVEP